MKKCIITIGRQCGSGGHTIGKSVADKLGIPLYDRKLVEIVAERSGLSAETVQREGEYATTSLLTSIEHGIAPGAAESHVKNRDKKRAAYYKYLTDRIWGAATNYDLCLNSSKLGIDCCVDIICNYCLNR